MAQTGIIVEQENVYVVVLMKDGNAVSEITVGQKEEAAKILESWTQGKYQLLNEKTAS